MLLYDYSAPCHSTHFFFAKSFMTMMKKNKDVDPLDVIEDKISFRHTTRYEPPVTVD